MTYDSSGDSLRWLTNDLGRHRLTDLVEADEGDDVDMELRSPSRRKRYSSIGSTASSMEGLWETHPRRLSEAGLSRHSDSAVLTEDTDSFIIGQRVWVGGSKPGTIAYIGDTQFAPGEWAGIVLDEPIGKNDGSVGGSRYFQCEPKRGVFSRLTRLTRVPLEQPGMGSNETFITPTNGTRRSPISPISPTSSTSFLKSPVSLSNSTTSLSSNLTHVDFKVGDRVIIKSSQGSKVGTVKYMGLTDFAPGEWVGVELDDPRGKNDGSVEGKRYFECRPNFGLFAPIAKVSKSPSKYKPGVCAAHSGLPPSGLKRTNSKESMASMTSKTSVASSIRRVRLGVTSLTPKNAPSAAATPVSTRAALQDVLREKQQHIEQLLKERDLERAEVTKAAELAHRTEQKLLLLTQDFEKYRADCEIKVRENGEAVARLNVDRTELLNQLEEEKRRNEDLQFRFEEAAISKSDLEAVNETSTRKVTELEETLAVQLTQLESVSDSLFEAEENLIKSRDDADRLNKELEEAKKYRELSAILQAQIEALKSENNALKEDASNNCQRQGNEIEELKAKMTLLLDEKSQLEAANADLVKENQKLKMELSAKTLDLETANEKLESQESKSVEVEEQHSRHVRQVETQEAQIMALSAELQVKNEEILKSSIVIGKLEEDLCAKNSVIEKLKLELQAQQSQQEAHTEKISELSLSQGDVQKELILAKQQMASLINVKQRLEAEVQTLTARCDNTGFLEQVRQEMAAKEAMFEAYKAQLAEKLQDTERSKNELQVKYQHDLVEFAQIRQDLEARLAAAAEASKKVASLEQLIHQKDTLLLSIQGRCGDIETMLAASNAKIAALTEESARLTELLARKSEEVIEATAQSSRAVAQAQQTAQEQHQHLEDAVRKLQYELNEKVSTLNQLTIELNLARNDCQQGTVDLTEKNKQIGELVAEVQQSKSFIAQLQEELTRMQLAHQQTLSQDQEAREECRGLLEQVAVLNQQVANGELCFKNLQSEHNSALEVMNLLRITQQQKEQCLQQLQADGSKNCENMRAFLDRLGVSGADQNQEKIASLQKEIDVNRNVLAQKNYECEAHKIELLKLQEELVKAQELNAKAVVGGNGNQNSQLVHDKELAENQIRFLNSIIVDIQKKNEEQKARIQILEQGYSPAMANELIGLGEVRLAPPRVYCDICEEFDLHETEDCPKQNTDVVPGYLNRTPAEAPPERPYCELCEVFGHATEDCQEDQTF